jgi:hypothetical protein
MNKKIILNPKTKVTVIERFDGTVKLLNSNFQVEEYPSLETCLEATRQTERIIHVAYVRQRERGLRP